MKTIQELNSKWYWRLIKVIWILICLIILIASAVGFFELNRTYDPKDINKVSEEITEYYERYTKLADSLKNSSERYEAEELRKINYIRNGKYEVSHGTLLYILSHNPNTNIEGVVFLKNKENDYYYRCPSDTCAYYTNEMPNDLSEYIESGSTLYITSEDVSNFSNYESALTTLNNSLIEFNDGDKSFNDVYTLRNNFFNKNEYFYRTYRGINEWILIILSTIGVCIGILIFTLIIRGIIYYIILGKFNPEK